MSLLSILLLSWVGGSPRVSSAPAPHPLPADTALSDAAFYEALNLDHPGLERVKAALLVSDSVGARQHLCAYYRGRGPGFWWRQDESDPRPDRGEQALEVFAGIQEQRNEFAPKNWRSNPHEFDWTRTTDSFQRMYFFGDLGRAYRHSRNEDIVKKWIDLYRAWIRQYREGQWNRLSTAIRLRSGWSEAFVGFVRSPSLDDESLLLFLKSYYEQALYLRREHSETSNWLTFEMAGLFSAGVLFPELKPAAEWRDYAMQTAYDDLERGWLPDGVTIELSPGYGKFFSNYLLLTDLARETRQLQPLADVLEQRTERLFDPYLAMMTPDWRTPAFQDNYMVEVPEFLRGALARFPGREDFRWAVTQGREGQEPKFQSVALPYAGYLIIRSSWKPDAHYLAFDAGPVGYRHAHQDKLSLVLYAFGRQILFDPGRRNGKEPYSTHLRDTFAHNTGLVDNRPQRRKWYQYPKPSAMPYQPLADFQSETTRGRVWASGVYMDHYGLPGASNNHSYPYGENSNFGQGWGKPASHFRQVLFVAPDLFVVQDHFVPNDGAVHAYEIRWQMDSVRVRTDAALRAVSEDAGQPNLGIIPLQTEGLRVETVSMGPEPELMGWKVLDTLHPATTVRHLQTGVGIRTFLTLLLPRRADEPADAVVTAANDGRISVRLPGGRQYRIQPAGTPHDRVEVSEVESSQVKASDTR